MHILPIWNHHQTLIARMVFVLMTYVVLQAVVNVVANHVKTVQGARVHAARTVFEKAVAVVEIQGHLA